MAAETTIKRRPTYNPEMLRWARKRAGVSTAEAARRVSVKEEWVTEWERDDPERSPTVNQARNLANLYKRKFIEFFRPQVPDLLDPELIPDFRLYPSSSDPSSERGLRDIQIWAEAQRQNAIELFEQIGDSPPILPGSAFRKVSDDPEEAAADTRLLIDFPISEQVGRTGDERKKIPAEIRRRIEAVGVLSLRRTDLNTFRVRGFCIVAQPLPVIVIGKEEGSPGEAFTLAHEFAHILLRQSAISGPPPRTGGDPQKRTIEQWCDNFSGAFLMPQNLVEQKHPKAAQPLPQIADDVVHKMSLYFGVSDHAMMVRLVVLGHVDEEFYWTVKKPEYDKWKQRGGPPLYYGTRYRNIQGDMYTGLVLDAWSLGKLTGHHAAEYMGIKNIQHVYDIREHFRNR